MQRRAQPGQRSARRGRESGGSRHSGRAGVPEEAGGTPLLLQGRAVSNARSGREERPQSTALGALNVNHADAHVSLAQRTKRTTDVLRERPGVAMPVGPDVAAPRSQHLAELTVHAASVSRAGERPGAGRFQVAHARPHTAASIVNSSESEHNEGGRSAWQRLTRPSTSHWGGVDGEGLYVADAESNVPVGSRGANYAAAAAVPGDSGQDSDGQQAEAWARRFTRRLQADGDHSRLLLSSLDSSRSVSPSFSEPLIEKGCRVAGRGMGEQDGKTAMLLSKYYEEIETESAGVAGLDGGLKSGPERATDVGSAHCTPVSLSGSARESWEKIPALSAPGLDDAVALLRSWIDSSVPCEQDDIAGVGRERLSVQSGGQWGGVENSGHSAGSAYYTRLSGDDHDGGHNKSAHERHSTLSHMHESHAELGTCVSSDDDRDPESGEGSRWQTMFSREAVRKSITSLGETTGHETRTARADETPEIGRPTAAWRRRAVDADGVERVRRRSLDRLGLGQSCRQSSNVLSTEAVVATTRVKPRDVLKSLETRHEERLQQRLDRRAFGHSSDAAGTAPATGVSAHRRGRSARCGDEGLEAQQEAALQREMDMLRAQIRAAAGVRGRRPGSRERSKRGAGADGLEQLRIRRLGGGAAHDTSLVQDMARNWSARACGHGHDGAGEIENVEAEQEEENAQEAESTQEEEGLGFHGEGLLGRQEWQDVLENHVDGFSASLTRRLSETKNRLLDLRSNDTLPAERDRLVVCAAPGDHPFRRVLSPACPEHHQAAEDESGNTLLSVHTLDEGDPDANVLARDDAQMLTGNSNISHSSDMSVSATARAEAVLCKVMKQRERSRNMQLLACSLVLWAPVAARRAANARKVKKAVGLRRLGLRRFVLDRFRRLVRDGRFARKQASIQATIADMVSGRRRSLLLGLVRAWQDWVGTERHERLVEEDRERRRLKMLAVVEAASLRTLPRSASGGSGSDLSSQVTSPSLQTVLPSAMHPSEGITSFPLASTGATAYASTSEEGLSAGEYLSEGGKWDERISGTGEVVVKDEGNVEFHKSCESMEERHARRLERRRALQSRYKATQEAREALQRQQEEEQKAAQMAARAEARRKQREDALQAQEALEQQRQVAKERSRLAALHCARATLRFRGLVPWHAGVIAVKGALAARCSRSMQARFLGAWRRTALKTRALFAAADGLGCLRARMFFVRLLRVRVVAAWRQHLAVTQAAVSKLGMTSAQAPLRTALSVWANVAREASAVRAQEELEALDRADAVFAVAAQRGFLRRWEQASSLERALRVRQQMRHDLKTKVQGWISEFRSKTEEAAQTEGREGAVTPSNALSVPSCEERAEERDDDVARNFI